MAKIVFMGTPAFAVPSLKALMQAHEVIGVITQPDRPAGRKRRLRESPIKSLARAAGIPIMQPRRIREAAAIEALRTWDADVFVVAAYGQILPQALLDLPPAGTVNVHASLLPRWRGAAPIQAAIRAGDSASGATIMLVDAGLDTGPLLAKRELPLANNETGGSLHDKLSRLGADLLAETLPRYLSGLIEPQAQDDSLATYAPQIKKEEGRINWDCSAQSIERLARAFTPWPGAFTTWREAQLRILAGRKGEGSAEPGRVIVIDGAAAVGTGDGLFFPTRLQMAGKRPLHIADFVNGYREFAGARLGD
ncbi:MAG: methionyl-tRNA formyltransferase [Chloroflexota bacterium]|nr:methionyl-tRNA formyltransferase [Chloroflexota bacterium]MDE2909143.1 methionyl-tRNA formyltransferase [Chloroflexota bacterium]